MPSRLEVWRGWGFQRGRTGFITTEATVKRPHKPFRILHSAFCIAFAFCIALAALAANAYNSLAPHGTDEITDFWDTTGYDVAPASSASGVCATAVNRLLRTEDVSANVVSPFRRERPKGMVIILR